MATSDLDELRERREQRTREAEGARLREYERLMANPLERWGVPGGDALTLIDENLTALAAMNRAHRAALLAARDTSGPASPSDPPAIRQLVAARWQAINGALHVLDEYPQQLERCRERITGRRPEVFLSFQPEVLAESDWRALAPWLGRAHTIPGVMQEVETLTQQLAEAAAQALAAERAGHGAPIDVRRSGPVASEGEQQQTHARTARSAFGDRR